MSTKQFILVSSPTATEISAVRISDDGRYVAFYQQRDYTAAHPFVLSTKDLQTGITTVVESSDSSAAEFDLSGDGGLLAYEEQTDYVVDEVKLWDRSTSATRTLLSADVPGSREVIWTDIDFSSNGQYVEVDTDVPGIAPGQSASAVDDIQIDVQTGAGEDLAQNEIGEVAQSADGRYVLVGGLPDDYSRLDRTTGTLVRLATSSTVMANITFSGDGRYAVFDTPDALVPEDTNDTIDVYIQDCLAGTFELLSKSSTGVAGNGSSYLPVISADGARVAFITEATNLAPGTPAGASVILNDLATGISTYIAVDKDDDYEERALDISADGLSIAFVSDGHLTSDANSLRDAYVARFTPPTISITSVSGDNYINAAEAAVPVVVRGVSNDPNAHVVVTSPSGAIASTTAGSDGSWSVSVGIAGVADGNRDFSATITDDIATFLTATATRPATIDTLPPALTLAVDGGDTVNAAQLHAAVISGMSDAIGQTVTLTIDGIAAGTATVQTPAVPGGFGSWTITYDASHLTEGQHDLDAKVADPAGNLTDRSIFFDVDTTPPKIAITAIGSNDVVSATEAAALVPITGTSDAIGQTVTITAGNKVRGTTIVQADGTWTANVALPGTAGSTIVFANVADRAGNVGGATDTAFVDSDIVRVSVAADGTQGTGDPDFYFGFTGNSVSADGHYVLFDTDVAGSLIPGAGHSAELLKDNLTGALSVVAQADDGTISRDGQVVVDSRYELETLSTGALTPIATTAGGVAANGPASGSPRPDISSDGRYVVFTSTATNLVGGLPAQTNDPSDRVFVKDLQTGAVSLVSFATQDQPLGYVPHSGIGGDRYVAFESSLSGGANDTNSAIDIYLRDIQTGAVTLVSATPSGVAANAASFEPEISADGRYVAFYSTATNLIAGKTLPAGQAYLRDLATGTTTLLSSAADGTPIGAYAVDGQPNFVFTADDHYVAFYTSAKAAAGDTNASNDVYLKDLQTGALELLSSGGPGPAAGSSAHTFNFDLTPDGRYVTFSTNDPGLVPGDTNGLNDIFLRRLVTSDMMAVDPITGDNVIDAAERGAAVAVTGHTSLSGGAVTILIDGTKAASAAIETDGSWGTTINVLNLAGGAHKLVASGQDGAGFTTSVGVSLAVVAGQLSNPGTVAQFQTNKAAYDALPGGFAIADSEAAIIGGLADLTTDASRISSITSTDVPVLVGVAKFTPDRQVLDKVSGGFNINGQAAAISGALDALESDAGKIGTITALNGTVMTSVASFTADKQTLDKIGSFAISDTDAAIVAGLPALTADATHIASITSTDTPVMVGVAKFTPYQAALDKVVGGFKINGQAVAIQQAVDQLEADQANIISVTSVDTPVAVGVGKFTPDRQVLDKVVGGFNINGQASAISGALDALQNDIGRINAITALNGTVTASVASFNADKQTLDMIGSFAISDTDAAIVAALPALTADAGHIASITSTDMPVMVGVAKFTPYQAALDKVVGDFKINGQAVAIQQAVDQLEADQANIISVTSVDTLVAVGVGKFTPDRQVLDKVVGGFKINGQSLAISGAFDALSADAKIQSLAFADANPVLTLTQTQATNDAALIAKITGSYTENVTNAGSTTTTGHGNGLTITAVAGGHDTITGNGTSETFVFKPSFGQDTITDFSSHLSGAGHDTITLPSSEFANFAAVLADAHASGADMVITAAGHPTDVLTLSNLTAANLQASGADFKFV